MHHREEVRQSGRPAVPEGAAIDPQISQPAWSCSVQPVPAHPASAQASPVHPVSRTADRLAILRRQDARIVSTNRSTQTASPATLRRFRAGDATPNAAIRRKFTIVDTNTLIGNLNQSFALSPATVQRLKKDHGATDREIAIINDWALLETDVAGSPFANYGALVAAALLAPDPVGPAPVAASSANIQPVQHGSRREPPPQIPVPASRAAGVVSSVGMGGPQAPPQSVTGFGASALLAQMGSGHNRELLAASGLTVEVTEEGFFSLSGQLEAAGVYLAQIPPNDFKLVIQIVKVLARNEQLGELSQVLNRLSSSGTQRLRPGVLLQHGINDLAELGVNPNAGIFKKMKLAERIRLYDIINSSDYPANFHIPGVRKAAAEFALRSDPADAFEFVSKYSFYIQAADTLGLDKKAAPSAAENVVGSGHSEPDVPQIATSKTTGTGPARDPGFGKVNELLATITRVVNSEKLVSPVKLKDFNPGSFDQDVAMKVIDELVRKGILGFGSVHAAADHIVKHPLKGPQKERTEADWAQEARVYLAEARTVVLKCPPEEVIFKVTQTGGWSLAYGSADGSRTIVVISGDGTARIATYTSRQRN